jgi:hypothetical protein
MSASTKLILLSRASLLLLLLVLLLHGRGGLCMGLQGMDAMEMEMDSESHRRLLWQASGRRYISYDALRSDVVPCSRPGVPYYNCRITTTANPYSRGCESITRCREAADP